MNGHDRDGACHLFVYGTLRRRAGHPMGVLLRDAQFVGEGTVPGRLYDLGPYPGMLPGSQPRDRVRGEVYRLQSPKLRLGQLDHYEGCGGAAGDEYRRRRMTVRMDDGATVSAWLYVYNGAVRAGQRIAGGDYLRRGGVMKLRKP